jgi:hypothetical protein
LELEEFEESSLIRCGIRFGIPRMHSASQSPIVKKMRRMILKKLLTPKII